MTAETAEESPAQRAARLRREKREKKVTEGGASRLERISGISGREQDLQPKLPPKPNTADPLDPPEIDISSSPPTFTSPSNNSIPATAPQQDPFLALMQQAQQAQQQQNGIHNPSAGPNADDPMMQMLQQIFQPPPNGTSSPIPGAAGTPGGPPGGLPPGLAALLGGDNGALPNGFGSGEPAPAPSTTAWIWPILHAVFSLLLAAYIGFVLPFDGSRAERESPLAQPIGIFWIFVTIELGLQSARFMLEKGGGVPAGMLGKVAAFLPQPYGGYVNLALRYSGYWTTLNEDMMVVVFVLGCVAWWKGKVEWQW